MEPKTPSTGHTPSPLADDSAVAPLIAGGILAGVAAIGHLFLIPSDPVDVDTARNAAVSLKAAGTVGVALMFYAAVLVTAKVQESHQLLLQARQRQDR